MSRTPIDPKLIRTQKDIDRGSVLLESLFTLFRPFVEPVAKPKILAMLAEPLTLDDESIANMTSAVQEGVAQGQLPEITHETFAALEAEMRNPTPLTAEELEAEAAEELDNACCRLVTAWIDCIHLGIPGDTYDERILDTSTIGDDMFPPIDPEIAGVFDECCAKADLTPDEARGILRAVRATLPEGKRMPDDAVELLRINRVTVV